MRIAQVAPLWEQVPPLTYGGIELVVHLLTDELTCRGHEVTLFATGDSTTLANLTATCPKSLRLEGITPQEYALYEQMLLSQVYGQADQFDVIHSHLDYAALPYANFARTPTIHTIHGILSPLMEKIFVQNRHQNFVSISNSQQRTDLALNYVATVYNAINVSTYEFHAQPDEPPYLAFLGRLSQEKGPHLAIEIAKRTGYQLKIAGKVGWEDQEFFAQEVEPLIDGQQIQYLGEANHGQKCALMGGAVATLFPILWEEPFGLVMPESMACGTPVVAMEMGSTPEIIVHGKTGFLCNNVDDCVQAIAHIKEIDRYACRQHVEQNFGIKRMVDGYERVYRQVATAPFSLNRHSPKHSSALLAS